MNKQTLDLMKSSEQELIKLQFKTIEFLKKTIELRDIRIEQQSRMINKLINELDLIRNYGIAK